MRDAETTLAIIRERGRRGLNLEDLYRQLFNPDLYLRAYGRIAKEPRQNNLIQVPLRSPQLMVVPRKNSSTYSDATP